MSVIEFKDGVRIATSIRLDGSPTVTPGWTRANLIQESLAKYPLPWENWRVHDAFGTLLPATPATDDLGLVGAVFGTGVPSIQTGDLKAAGATTRYARTTVTLPPEYEAGTDVVILLHAGMFTTISDTTATIDIECYKSDQEGIADGSPTDLCATSPTDINSTSLSDKSFVITATSLSPGDTLDIRLAIAINDGATGTAVTGVLGAAFLTCDIRG